MLKSWSFYCLQLQLYAVKRANLVEFELDVEHRGYAFLESGATPTGGILLPLLTAGQVLMNVAIALIIMRLVTSHSSRPVMGMFQPSYSCCQNRRTYSLPIMNPVVPVQWRQLL